MVTINFTTFTTKNHFKKHDNNIIHDYFELSKQNAHTLHIHIIAFLHCHCFKNKKSYIRTDHANIGKNVVTKYQREWLYNKCVNIGNVLLKTKRNEKKINKIQRDDQAFNKIRWSFWRKRTYNPHIQLLCYIHTYIYGK